MDVRIDGYENLKKIAEGGFSDVYRAQDLNFDRPVAIKVLKSQGSDALDADAFTRECQAIGPISNHPNIVNVFRDGKTADGRPYIAMEYYVHGSLLDQIPKHGTVPFARVLRVGIHIADALERAHAEGILHRDIKPQNILFSEYKIALADFGIAYRMLDGTKVEGLTPHYAAPESLAADESSVQSDIYSLGATLYTALAGRRPFHSAAGDNGKSAVRKRIMTNPVPPIVDQSVPPALESYICRMMAKSKVDRPNSAAEVAEKLRSLQDNLDFTVSPADRDFTSFPHSDSNPTESSGRQLGDRATEDLDPASDEPLLGNPTSVTIARPFHPERDLSDALAEVSEVEEAPAWSATIDRRVYAAFGLLVSIVALGLLGAVLARSQASDDAASITVPVAPQSTTIGVVNGGPETPGGVNLRRDEVGNLIVGWEVAENAASYRVSLDNDEVFDSDAVELEVPAEAAPPEDDVCLSVVAIGASGRTSAASNNSCLPGSVAADD